MFPNDSGLRSAKAGVYKADRLVQQIATGIHIYAHGKDNLPFLLYYGQPFRLYFAVSRRENAGKEKQVWIITDHSNTGRYHPGCRE